MPTLYYTMLNRLARNHSDLADALQPANALFARRSDEVKQERTVSRADRKSSRATTAAEAAARSAKAVHARHSATSAGDSPSTPPPAATNGSHPPT